MHFFIEDLLEQVGNLTAVTSSNYKFKMYDFEKIKGKKFIIGKGKPINLKDNSTEIDGIELLFSMINLIKGNFTRYLNEEQMEKHISDDDVLKWVEMYGLPYRDEKLNQLLEDQLIRVEYLDLDGFKYRLARLYAAFYLWKALINEEPNEVNKFRYRLLKFEEANNQIKNLKNYSDVELLKDALGDVVSIDANVKVNIKYDNCTKSFKFVLEADSLFNIAYYQLSALMTKPLTENKKKMKTCKQCNAIYWANHANSRYCQNCDRRTAWSRRKKS